MSNNTVQITDKASVLGATRTAKIDANSALAVSLDGGIALSTPVTATLTLASSVQVIAAPAAGQSLYITDWDASNTSATLTRLDLQEGSGGTIRVSAALAANGGGIARTYRRAWKLPAATGLFATLGTAVTDIRLNVTAFTAP